MQHNLFSHPNEYTIEIDDNEYKITNEMESNNILDILDDIGYNTDEILNKLKTDINSSSFITEQEKSDTLSKLEIFLHQNGYLRTTN